MALLFLVQYSNEICNISKILILSNQVGIIEPLENC